MLLLGTTVPLLALASAGCGSDDDPSGGTGGAGGAGGSGGATGMCNAAVAPFGTDPAASHSFPDIEITDCNGKRQTLDELRCSAKVTLVSIGAGWCQPCKDETPLLQELKNKMGPQGVEVVQIMFEDAQGNPATTLFCETWRDTYTLTLPLYVDPAANTLAYFNSVKAPLNLLLDRDGKVLWSEIGVIPKDLEGTVTQYLK